MAVDFTVLAIPGYIAAMVAEHRWQRRTTTASEASEQTDYRPGDYEFNDTLASLSMGIGSLIAPAVAKRLFDPVTPGKGRWARALLGAGLAAAAVATMGDVRRRRHLPPGTRPDDLTSSPDYLTSTNDRVTAASGVAAVAAIGLTASSTWGVITSGRRLHRLGGRDLGTGPKALAVALLGWDFLYYWNHRLSHESRWLWAVHVVHHSSERYNLSTALRQPVAVGVSWSVPYGLLAYAGVRPALIEQARALNLLYQFLIHTETVRSLGPLERVLNTPSHHRVHHGVNRQYLDRNHGSILIIWDRLFGTFEPEVERPVYGLTRNINTFNPLRIAAHEWLDIARDIAASHTWRDRVSFLVRGPGWAYRRRTERTLAARIPTPRQAESSVRAKVRTVG